MINNNFIKICVVLEIVVLFVGSAFAAGVPSYPERIKETLTTVLGDSKLSNGTIADCVHSMQELIKYHKEVIAEEEQYRQLMEKEYIRYKNFVRVSPDYLSGNPFVDLSHIRSLIDVHPYFSDKVSDGILEKRVSKPRPLPTGVTLYVGGTGPNNYTRIQDAIDDTIDGDTVFVYCNSSPYFENIVVDKSIYLIGEDNHTTVIDGQEQDAVITISSDYVHVESFTIRNGSAGIDLSLTSQNHQSTNNTFTNNIIINNNLWGGIELVGSSNNVVSGNTIANNHGVGIYLSNFDTISGNTIENNSIEGIFMNQRLSASIMGNTLKDNGIFIDGVELVHWNSHTIENNTLNGKPIRYYKNCNNIVVPDDAAQIIMANCNGCTIHNTSFSIGPVSIQLAYCRNNFITDNTVINNVRSGISLISSSNNILSGNTITNNTGNGIYIQRSSSISIMGNTLKENGIDIDGVELAHWNSHTIENNTLNGKPIRYYKNCNNIVVPDDAAQIIMANCNGCTIQNTSLSVGSIGIQVAYCKNGFIKNNIITNNRESGIRSCASSNNTISSNTIANNSEYGIVFDSSPYNILSGNIVTNNNEAGIGLDVFSTYSGDTINTTISDNTIVHNGRFGISLGNTWNNTISSNIIANNSEYGLVVGPSENNIISGNTIANNGKVGIWLIFSTNNTLSSNTIIQNRINGISLDLSFFNKISNNLCISNRIDGIGLQFLCLANTIENNTCLNNMKGIAIRNSALNNLQNNKCNNNQQGILLNNAYLTKISDNHCSFNSIAIYLYKSRLNCIKNNFCNHSDFDGIVLEHSGFNIIKNNDAGPYNYIGIVIQTSTFNWLVHNNVYQNVGYGIVLLKTIGNHLHFNNFNNVYNKAQKDLLGLLCFDNARENYWSGGTAPHKLVLGWVRVWPWLRNPVEDSRNLDDILMNDMSTLQEFRTLSSSLIKREQSYSVHGRMD